MNIPYRSLFIIFVIYVIALLIIYNLYPFYLGRPCTSHYLFPDLDSHRIMVVVKALDVLISVVVLSIIISVSVVQVFNKGYSIKRYSRTLAIAVILFYTPFIIMFLLLNYPLFVSPQGTSPKDIAKFLANGGLIIVYASLAYDILGVPLYIFLLALAIMSSYVGVGLKELLRREYRYLILLVPLVLFVRYFTAAFFSLLSYLFCRNKPLCLIYYRGINEETLRIVLNRDYGVLELAIPTWIDAAGLLAQLIILYHIIKYIAQKTRAKYR